jgi:hypothetical protein
MGLRRRVGWAVLGHGFAFRFCPGLRLFIARDRKLERVPVGPLSLQINSVWYRCFPLDVDTPAILKMSR